MIPLNQFVAMNFIKQALNVISMSNWYKFTDSNVLKSTGAYMKKGMKVFPSLFS